MANPLEAQLQLTANQLALLRLAIGNLTAQLQASLARAVNGSVQHAQLWGLLGDASTALGRIDRAAAHLRRRADLAAIKELRERLAQAEALAAEDRAAEDTRD